MNIEDEIKKFENSREVKYLTRPNVTWSICILFCVMLGLYWWMQRPAHYVIAVSTDEGVEAKVVQSLVDALKTDGGNVRLKILKTNSLTESTQALATKKADLAVTGSGEKMPVGVTTLMGLRKFYPFVISKENKKIEGIANLRGKHIGVDASLAESGPFLQKLLLHWKMKPEDYTLVPIALNELSSALTNKKIDAYFSIGIASNRPNAEVIETMLKAFGKSAVTILPFSEIDALAAKIPGIEAGQIPKGYFRADPLLPDEDLDDISISTRIVASDRVGNDQAVMMTRKLLALRAKKQSDIPELLAITEPDLENTTMPVHPGTKIELNGEYKSFFDKFSDSIYLVMALAGVVGSIFSTIQSRNSDALREEFVEDVRTVLHLGNDVTEAKSESEINDILKQVDTILQKNILASANGDIDQGSLEAMREAVVRCQRAADANVAFSKFNPAIA